MSQDPFARFESSRGGWVIPIGIFLIGAIATTGAINLLHRLEVPVDEEMVEPVNGIEPQPIAPAAPDADADATRELESESAIEPATEPVTETAEPEYS